MIRLGVALLALAMLAGCGRAGPPRVPGPKDQITYPQTYLLEEDKAALAQTPFFGPVDLKRTLGSCSPKR